MIITPGMLIGDRYEIIEKIGTGGMADVYKAKCHRLNRMVAIKFLKPEYSSDNSFVSRFRGEAESSVQGGQVIAGVRGQRVRRRRRGRPALHRYGAC